MTDEELESMEIDWTQGVAENFERVKSAALAALEAANRRVDAAEAESNAGWLFLNPDTGIEFNVNHPVESGEVPDAKNITSATAPALLHLLTEEWRDGKARESELTALRARVAELEAGGCARDQGTTQYCAEAVALQKRVAELEEQCK